MWRAPGTALIGKDRVRSPRLHLVDHQQLEGHGSGVRAEMPDADRFDDEVTGAKSLALAAFVLDGYFALHDIGVALEGVLVARQLRARCYLQQRDDDLRVRGRQHDGLADGG